MNKNVRVMKPKTIMNRENLIRNLEKKGITVVGNSEEFDGTKGGIWISAEDFNNQLHFDYYSENKSFELGVRTTTIDFLFKRGWFAEWHDPGTIMIWKM
jgi:hypothetical protein